MGPPRPRFAWPALSDGSIGRALAGGTDEFVDARDAAGSPTRDVTVWSYEPGIVDTPMQDAVRGSSVEKLPIVGFFHQVKADGQLLGPDVPAKAIVQHIEADGHPRFSEQRFQL